MPWKCIQVMTAEYRLDKSKRPFILDDPCEEKPGIEKKECRRDGDKLVVERYLFSSKWYCYELGGGGR